jgi:hypothetical protein
MTEAIKQNKEEKGFRHIPTGELCSTHNLVPPQKDITEDVVKKAVNKIYPDLDKQVTESAKENKEDDAV